MITIEETLKFIDDAACEVAGPKPVVISESSLEVGQFLPQGDVALLKMSEVPEGAVQVNNPSPKVVAGTTQGSQHVWDSMEGIEAFEPPASMKSPTVGLIYKLNEERTLTHPDHGHHTYHEGFIGCLTHQRTISGNAIAD